MDCEHFHDFHPDETLSFFVKHFLKQRRIYIWGGIDLYNSYFVVNSLRYLSNKSLEPIHIYINSEGGDIDSLSSILDEIERIKKLGITVITVCQGAAYSCAAFILAAGTKGYRIATPLSTILLHPISYSLDFESTDKNKRFSDFIDRQNNMLMEMIAEFCDQTSAAKLKKFKDLVKGEVLLNAKEALKFKIIDNIGDI